MHAFLGSLTDCAIHQTPPQTVLYSKQFDKLLTQAGRRQVRSLLTVCDIDIFMFLSIVLYASTYLCNELMSLQLS